MFEFAKVTSHIGDYGYMLVVRPNTDSAKGFDLQQMGDRLLRTAFIQSISNPNYGINSISDFTSIMPLQGIDYQAKADEWGRVLLVREIGSYMCLSSEMTLSDTCYSKYFPRKQATICICENDAVAEPFWVEYLQKRFKEPIKVIPFFGQKSDEEVREALVDCEYVTFSTTFSNYTWFEKLLRCKPKTAKIIGYSHDPKKWEEVKVECEKVFQT